MAAGLQIVALNGAAPSAWQGFAERWRSWRAGFSRETWAQSWQARAWREGQLIFPSPWGARNLATQLSVRRGLVFGYVLQEGLKRALLLPGWLGAGHELEALYLVREQVLLLLPCSLAPAGWFVQVLGQLLPRLAEANSWPTVLDVGRPRHLILEGHPNYAHQLLNVLTALDELNAVDPPQLHWLGQQPFGPVADLYPEQRWASAADCPAEPALGSCFELPLSQRPERIPAELRGRLRRFCEAQLSDSAAALLGDLERWRAGGGWVLWVSLKTRGAWAEGLPQQEAMLPLLLLDGFSLQAGDDRHSRHYGVSVATLLAEEEQQADALEALLQGLQLPVRRAIGFSLADSIALGQAVDGYFCHQGTVQHKLGWLQQGLPGVVHSCSARNRGGVHPWGSLGDAVMPQWIPADFCEDLEEGPRGRYRFRGAAIDQAALWLANSSSIARLSCSS
jgi:hypothetical protein